LLRNLSALNHCKGKSSIWTWGGSERGFAPFYYIRRLTKKQPPPCWAEASQIVHRRGGVSSKNCPPLLKQHKVMSNWWEFAKKEDGFAARKKQISKYRSPSTIADEIYRILSWGLQPLLAVFCIALSFSSYHAFFGMNFSPLFAAGGAIILSTVIELGKIKLGGYVFQVPFLSGTKILGTSFAAFAVWFGAAMLTAVTFTMSVKNSTSGAEMLALKNGFEKNTIQFQPNTAQIDAQIAASDKRLQSAQNIKWKGVVTYQAQKAIQRESATMRSLSEQKAALVQQQIDEHQKKVNHQDKNTALGAEILFASGGWVELLQLICLFLIAACMATIDKVMTNESEEVQQTPSPPPAPKTEFQHGRPFSQNASGIGFYWDGYGTKSPHSEKSVTHPEKSVTHQADGDTYLRLARKDFGSWAGNYRSGKHDPKTVEKHLESIINDLLQKVGRDGFEASLEVTVQSHEYFARKFQELEEIGRPVPQAPILLRQLESIYQQQYT
jgi:hypothetical protein